VLRLTAHVFETLEPILIIYGSLLRGSEHIINSNLIKFIREWRHAAKVSNPDFAFDDCYGNFSVTY